MTLDNHEERNFVLPDDWNKEANSYSLRYAKNSTVYVLLAIVDGNMLTVNLLVCNINEQSLSE